MGPAMCYLLRCRHKHSKSFSEHMESILLCSNSFFHPNAVLNCPGLYVVAIDIFLYNKNILLIIMFEPDSWSYMCADASFLRFMVTKRAIRCHTVGVKNIVRHHPTCCEKGATKECFGLNYLSLWKHRSLPNLSAFLSPHGARMLFFIITKPMSIILDWMLGREVGTIHSRTVRALRNSCR